MTTPLGLLAYRSENNLKSALLLAAFPLLLVLIVAAFFLITGLFYTDPQGSLPPDVWAMLGLTPKPNDGVKALMVAGVKTYAPYAVGVAALWTMVGFFFHGALTRWATGAKPLLRRDAPDLYNLLENLCIARGLRMPPLNLIDTPALNAFASGLGPRSYAITVTRGLVETLNKVELESVLAHELSHILNKDVRLVLISALFAGMLAFFSEMMFRSLRFGSSSNDHKGKGGGLIILAAILLFLGWIVSTLLRLALSRRREFMADALATEMTKRPEALISALQKISGHAKIEGVPSGIRAMFIENESLSFASFLATHPPIEARIAVLRRLGNLPNEGESIIPKT